VAAFDGGPYGDDFRIDPGATTSRELILAIPNKGSAAQQATINSIVRYGAALPNPVVVRPRVYP
jgi:hypothetical protein